MPTSKLDLSKDSSMTKGAKVLATAIRRNAPHEGIRKSVRIGRRQGTQHSRFITVLVGKAYTGSQHGSEYAARAFDIGSGIHGKAKHTYTITAVNAPKLIFRLRDGKLFKGKSVQHPGVEGTNYTRRSMDETKPEIRAILGKDALDSIRLYLRAEFRDMEP